MSVKFPFFGGGFRGGGGGSADFIFMGARIFLIIVVSPSLNLPLDSRNFFGGCTPKGPYSNTAFREGF